MEGLASIDWGELFGLSVPLAELIVRGTTMYWFLFVMFRFVVRRDVGAIGIADVLILVIVADAAQNAMSGEYTSVTDGMALVTTLIGWNLLLDWACFRYPRIRRLVQPRPLALVKGGRLLRQNMRKEFITEEELWSRLRQGGVESLNDVKAVYMETDGEISVIKRQ
ncbi:DUF421 domain-containing protein [Noviherbaspirillum saxi]|uniref:DUF421 domain-containing protein n=1 Tax=Noviherbaspirillum saxi TaxID=2320863 RepID=A0A3A3GAA9_9BURK|nr:YetF domain-containing protein [Noviherbaspirillum saxi]RJF99105.1 DUF421 domain-containing protein [Noviherbaspirillum saxi]